MRKKQNKTLTKLYEYKAWLENKNFQYRQTILELESEQAELNLNKLMRSNFEEEYERYSREINDWQKLINEAEVALVFIKTSIAFEED